MANIFQRIASWLWGSFKSLFNSNKEGILEDIKTIATPIIEVVGRIDLDGDGRISAANEILDAVEATGKEWGKVWLNKSRDEAIVALSQHYSDGDLKKWLSYSRIALAFVEKFGIQALPKNNRLVNAIIEIVLNEKLGK